MKTIRSLLACFAVTLGASLANAQSATPPVAEGVGSANTELNPPSAAPFWHARLGAGVNPVLGQASYSSQAHTGFGASLHGFIYLPHRFSVGAGFDWERYTYDSGVSGDPVDASPRYKDQALMHSRAMALVQWDVLPRGFINPYLLAGAGYGWEHAEVTTWQCSPKQNQGAVVGGGLGVEVALNQLLALGVEYRVNTLPLATRSCTLAFITNEPDGAPSDFLSQRVALTVGLRH